MGLAGPIVLEGARCRVAVPSDLVGSILEKILLSVEDGDVEQVCSNLKIILPYLRLLIFVSLSLSLVFISCMLLLFVSFTCLIFPCASIDIYAWVVCLLCIQPRES